MDKKVSKLKTEPLWNKLSNKDRELIIDYIPEYKLSQPDKSYRKNPDVFIRNRAWEDEIIKNNLRVLVAQEILLLIRINTKIYKR